MNDNSQILYSMIKQVALNEGLQIKKLQSCFTKALNERTFCPEDEPVFNN